MTDIESTNSKPVLIDTCAIITGEYMEKIESQNARIIYLDVDGFVKDKKIPKHYIFYKKIQNG